MTPLYSIGHSRHSAEHFIGLLRMRQIARLVDVRSHPVSKWAPQFAKSALQELLAQQGITYEFLGRELGGRPEGAQFYRADGTVDYAHRAQAADFAAGIARLSELAREKCTVMLCAEEDPAHCHRRLLVTPAMEAAGFSVLHLRGDGRVDPQGGSSAPSSQLGLFR
jgi:uncharacterized protein (DUF488 family)